MVRKILFSSMIVVANAAVAQAPNANQIVSVAHIDIMPDGVKKIGDAVKSYIASASKDKNAVEVKFVQQIGAPNHFTLVEVWADRKAYDAHVSAKETREFRHAIAPYLGSPYDERLHTEDLNFAH